MKTIEPWHSCVVIADAPAGSMYDIVQLFNDAVVVVEMFCYPVPDLDGVTRISPYDENGVALVRVPLQHITKTYTEDEAEALAELQAIDDHMLQCAR